MGAKESRGKWGIMPNGDAKLNYLVRDGHVCMNIYTQMWASKHTHTLGESSNKGQARDEEGDY